MNPSAPAAYAIVQLGDTITENLVDSVDFKTQAWPGTLTGGTVTGGEILADASAALFADPAQALFTDPAQALFDGYETIIYEVPFTVRRRGYLRLRTDLDGDAAIEYRAAGGTALFTNANQALVADLADPLFEAPPFIACQGPFQVSPGTQYTLRVTIPGAPARGRIGGLVGEVDVPTDSEHLEDQVVPAGGLTLTLAKPWDEIVRVSMVVQEAAGYAAVTARPMDKNPAGPTIKCFDVLNAATAGLVDVTIQGVPKI